MSVLNIFTLFLRFASLLLSFPKCFLSHWAKSPENKTQKNRLNYKRFKFVIVFYLFYTFLIQYSPLINR